MQLIKLNRLILLDFAMLGPSNIMAFTTASFIRKKRSSFEMDYFLEQVGVKTLPLACTTRIKLTTGFYMPISL